MAKVHRLRAVVIPLLTCILVLSGITNVSAAGLPPKGISTELWEAYKEMGTLDLEGGRRNFRWTTAPAYFAKGNPSAADIETLNRILYNVASNCSNITPGKASVEPREGVVLNFLKPSEFLTAIPSIPKDITTSYIYWTYYKNRGITKSEAVISTEETDLKYRNFLIRLRALQALGFYTLTEKTQYNLFSRSYNWENTGQLTSADKALLSFYCSNLVRAWDTEDQTLVYINQQYDTNHNTMPNFNHSVNVFANDGEQRMAIDLDGGQIILNGVRTITYRVLGKSNQIVDSGEIDVSADAFTQREIPILNLQSNQSYVLEIYNKNAFGFGYGQKVSFRTDAIKQSSTTSATPAQDAAAEVTDAYGVVKDSYDSYKSIVEDCLSHISDSSASTLFKKTKLNGICISKDKDAQAVLTKANQIIASKRTTSAETNALNGLADDMNAILEEADSYNAEVQDGLSTLEEIMSLSESTQEFTGKLSKSIDSFQSKLKKLPASTQTLIKKDTNFKALLALVSSNKKFTESIRGILLRLPTAQNAQALEGLLEFLKSDPNSTAEFDLDSLIGEVSVLFPEYICVKSTTIQIPKDGKCSKGYTKKLFN